MPLMIISQDLNGKWKGGLPQNDKTFVFTMKVEIQQKGENISGKAKYVDPTTNSYVIEKFIGSFKNNSVNINEYEVVESKINRGANFTAWCVKTMTGNLLVDRKQNLLTIEGSWFSSKVWDVRTKKYSQGTCAPGKFFISKELESLTRISGVVYNKESLQGIEAELFFENSSEV